MLRSDWSSLACQFRDLQILLRALELLLKIAEAAVCVSHVLNRCALARLVACENQKSDFELIANAAI